MAASLLEIPLRRIDGESFCLADLGGDSFLLVNTASECGFTPQYQGLEALHRRFHERGLRVVGFPCNQFGAQEPGDAARISEFCETRFGVSFTLTERVEVNGRGAHPLFVELKRMAPGLLGSTAVKWNFTKFLVDAGGNTVERFAPRTPPDRLVPRIEALLAG